MFLHLQHPYHTPCLLQATLPDIRLQLVQIWERAPACALTAAKLCLLQTTPLL